MSKISEAINEIYAERSKFVVIGLTGRTGSGCSTVAEILTQYINEVNLPCPNQSNFTSNEERKYRIIYNYMSKNWKPFYPITVTDIITLFILDNDLEALAEFIYKQANNHHDGNNKKEQFIQEIEIDYKKCYEMREKCKQKLKEIENKNDQLLESELKDFKDFYFKELSEFTKKLKEIIDKVYPQLGYTHIYQIIGDNIRSSGKAFEETFNPKKIYNFANLINKFVKLIRKIADKENQSAMIVIDAIRNPFEALFFKDRYSAFYLVSVNTPDDVRIERLRKSRELNDQQIKLIDKKEYPSKLRDSQVFISQNIQKCIEISDIHLTNSQLSDHNKSLLKKQLAQYLALIIHPGLVTPTPIERCMQIAYAAKVNSGCISRQVGAVITDKNYSIKAVGWNDTPSGQIPCLLRSAENLIRNDDEQAFSDYENNDCRFLKIITDNYTENYTNDAINDNINGRNISFCFKDIQNYIDGEKNQVHTRSLHAEENAFLQISKYGGQGIEGGILFTTASPCELCAKKAYQLGISQIVYIDPYPGIANNHILKSGSKDSRPEMELFCGAIGKAYHQLYQPFLAFKDELSMLIDISYYKTKSLEEENKSLKEEIQQLKNTQSNKA